jgi:hypothetical protein
MSKELAPSSEKLSFTEDCMPSTAVSIPTKAIIPTAMMRAVSTVRNIFSRIAPKATLIFSSKFIRKKEFYRKLPKSKNSVSRRKFFT